MQQLSLAPWPTGPAASGGEAVSRRGAQLAVMALISAFTLFERMGLNLGTYSVDAALLAIYALVAVLLLGGHVVVNAQALLLHAAALALALASLCINALAAPHHLVSPTSMLLLGVLYVPLLLRLRPLHGLSWDTVARDFRAVATLCAIAGVLQFFAQFVVRTPWLFDFRPLLPEIVRGPEGYNTVIPVGGFNKSNGFFLREPSGFSMLMALALLLELAMFKRVLRGLLFGLALLLSYSGTGLLALAIGLLYPPSARTYVRALLLVLAGGLTFALLGDALHLDFTLSRVGEFENERSSGYIRYVAPVRLLQESFFSEPWTALVGHGPGSVLRIARSFEFFDPTWAKLLYEYGLVGALLFCALVLRALAGSATPPSLKAALFMAWLFMGGHLLSPPNVALLMVLGTLCPADRSSPGEENA